MEGVKQLMLVRYPFHTKSLALLIINLIKAGTLGREAHSSFRSPGKMFGKTVVIVVLVTLVKNASGPIVNDTNSKAPKAPQREIIQYLNCSELHKRTLGGDDVIQLRNSIIVNASNPCIMKASEIILENNEFFGYQHAFNITAKKIRMYNNKFIGPEQNHYIVGDIVDLYYNTYQGDLQVHEVGGYIVTALMTVFDGQYRVHQYVATKVMVMD
ncbi:unnamed protein product [Euphydryas editha]|uniref:Uncharacterized protein n=1 Tax=Euphydryas editha TaxID=104508 RepID=A0AAU9UPX3_EUPED|nr:unnamed protein product [Euphydryas editha]